VEFHDSLPWSLIGQGGGIPLSPWALTDDEPVPGTTVHRSWGRGEEYERTPNCCCLNRGLIPEVRRRAASRAVLILLATLLLAQSLPRKRFFRPAFFARLHIEAVLLDFLDDVFLLHLTLESPQGILKRLTLLDNYLCQRSSPLFRFGLLACDTHHALTVLTTIRIITRSRWFLVVNSPCTSQAFFVPCGITYQIIAQSDTNDLILIFLDALPRFPPFLFCLLAAGLC
jgi:hypothetical protein